MAKIIEQTVSFPVSAAELYRIYLDSERHAAAIGSKASVDPKVGGAMTAHGMITGQFLHLVEGQLIVQTWRGNGFAAADTDSILILALRDVEGGAELVMTHANVPDQMYQSLKDGWSQFYWNRWQEYLAAR